MGADRCELVWPRDFVSHHARALRSAGLVASRHDGRMVMYSLTGCGRRLLDSVLEAEVTT